MTYLSKRVIRAGQADAAPMFESVVPKFIESPKPRQKSSSGRISFRSIQQGLDDLRAEAKALGREEGYEKGYAEGEKIGQTLGEQLALAEVLAEQRAVLQQFVDDLEEVAQAMRGAMDQWFVQAESALLPLVSALAAKVVSSELKSNPDVIESIVREAIQEVSHASTARILVNPTAFKVLQGKEAEIMALAPSLKNLEFVLDPTATEGCRIDTEGGRIDATVDTRIESIVDAIGEVA